MVKFNAISINTCQHWSHASIERGLIDYNLNIYVKYLSPEKKFKYAFNFVKSFSFSSEDMNTYENLKSMKWIIWLCWK